MQHLLHLFVQALFLKRLYHVIVSLDELYQSLLIKASNEREKRLENNNINGDYDGDNSISLIRKSTNGSGFTDDWELKMVINLNEKVQRETQCSINKMHVEIKIMCYHYGTIDLKRHVSLTANSTNLWETSECVIKLLCVCCMILQYVIRVVVLILVTRLVVL